ncbi:MAG: hypothetical protein EBY16_01760 [Gammaproteobacteria bacterium]|nr:hypothetical protein [Gammaproteobacteria bacterium]
MQNINNEELLEALIKIKLAVYTPDYWISGDQINQEYINSLRGNIHRIIDESLNKDGFKENTTGVFQDLIKDLTKDSLEASKSAPAVLKKKNNIDSMASRVISKHTRKFQENGNMFDTTFFPAVKEIAKNIESEQKDIRVNRKEVLKLQTEQEIRYQTAVNITLSLLNATLILTCILCPVSSLLIIPTVILSLYLMCAWKNFSSLQNEFNALEKEIEKDKELSGLANYY